jgi:hypothetical protein
MALPRSPKSDAAGIGVLLRTAATADGGAIAAAAIAGDDDGVEREQPHVVGEAAHEGRLLGELVAQANVAS